MLSESSLLSYGFYPAAEFNTFIGPLFFAGAFVCEDYLEEVDSSLPDKFFNLSLKELTSLVDMLAKQYLNKQKAFVVLESISTHQIERWGCWVAVERRYRPLTNKVKSLVTSSIGNEAYMFLPSRLFIETKLLNFEDSSTELIPAIKLAMAFAHYARARKLTYYKKLYPNLSITTGKNRIESFASSLKKSSSLPPFVVSSDLFNYYKKTDCKKPKWFNQLLEEIKYETRRPSRRHQQVSTGGESKGMGWRITPHVDYY